MIAPPGSSGVPSLRAPRPNEAAAVQAVWEASLGHDDPGGRPRGGWSVEAWATQQAALLLVERILGVAAIRAESGLADTVDARVALDPQWRTPGRANQLVQACIDLAREAHARTVRLFVPAAAAWTQAAARAAAFEPVRLIYHMTLPASVAVPAASEMPGIAIRRMREGEDASVLSALNRAWAGTWNFVPIRREMLEHDLDGQREGMLLGVSSTAQDEILATCHAVFDPTDRNLDGEPRAWISNLTVDPAMRGRGLARAMLSAGVAFLRERGAGSVTLGVDAGDAAPLRLYESTGFRVLSRSEAWDLALR